MTQLDHIAFHSEIQEAIARSDMSPEKQYDFLTNMATALSTAAKDVKKKAYSLGNAEDLIQLGYATTTDDFRKANPKTYMLHMVDQPRQVVPKADYQKANGLRRARRIVGIKWHE